MDSISLGFVLIAMLILWFIIGATGHWISKAVIIMVSLYFCLSVGLSIKNFMGWPIDEDLPEKFFVHWVVIDEPDRISDNEGAIYMWVKLLEAVDTEYPSWRDYMLSFYDGQSQPRAYKLPYSRELHEEAQDVIDMITQGEQVGGVNAEGTGDGDQQVEGMGEGANEDGNGESSLTRNGGISFYQLPPTKLPDKG